MGGRHLGAAWLENGYLHIGVCCAPGRGFLDEQHDGGCGVDESCGF